MLTLQGNLPAYGGVYAIRNKHEKLIYIGSSHTLKARANSWRNIFRRMDTGACSIQMGRALCSYNITHVWDFIVLIANPNLSNQSLQELEQRAVNKVITQGGMRLLNSPGRIIRGTSYGLTRDALIAAIEANSIFEPRR